MARSSSDSDEEANELADSEWEDIEEELTLDDAAALEAFMAPDAAKLRQRTLGDVIAEKLAERQQQGAGRWGHACLAQMQVQLRPGAGGGGAQPGHGATAELGAGFRAEQLCPNGRAVPAAGWHGRAILPELQCTQLPTQPCACASLTGLCTILGQAQPCHPARADPAPKAGSGHPMRICCLLDTR